MSVQYTRYDCENNRKYRAVVLKYDTISFQSRVQQMSRKMGSDILDAMNPILHKS